MEPRVPQLLGPGGWFRLWLRQRNRIELGLQAAACRTEVRRVASEAVLFVAEQLGQSGNALFDCLAVTHARITGRFEGLLEAGGKPLGRRNPGAQSAQLGEQSVPEVVDQAVDDIDAGREPGVAVLVVEAVGEVAGDQQVLTLVLEQVARQADDDAPIDGRLLNGGELLDLRRQLVELGFVANRLASAAADRFGAKFADCVQVHQLASLGRVAMALLWLSARTVAANRVRACCMRWSSSAPRPMS